MGQNTKLEKIVRDVVSAHFHKALIIAANWKMNMTILQGKQFLNQIDGMAAQNKILIFPPSTALASLALDFARNGIGYGPQNFSEKQQGAYTGEISVEMIREIGCQYALTGHSERRLYYHETDEVINSKVLRGVSEGLQIILCIGETLTDRESGSYRKVLLHQLETDLRGVRSEELSQIIIAYEPIWAIGTGKSASEEQIEETHGFIKQSLRQLYGCTIPVLYGGSVNDKNAAEIGRLFDVDGFLIGSAGLDAVKFSRIIRLAEESCNEGIEWNPCVFTNKKRDKGK